MMKDNLHRLMLCFAALNLSERELLTLKAELNAMSPRDFANWIFAIQHKSGLYGKENRYTRFAVSIEKRPPIHSNTQSIGDRVQKLLREDAGLSTAQAVTAFSEGLVEMKLIDSDQIPSLSRKSLPYWVNRLAQQVPEKDILRCATVVRNKYKHMPIGDWTLGNLEN